MLPAGTTLRVVGQDTRHRPSPARRGTVHLHACDRPSPPARTRHLHARGQGRRQRRRRRDPVQHRQRRHRPRPIRTPPTTATPRRPTSSPVADLADHQDRQPRPGHRRQRPDLHDHGHQPRPVRRPGRGRHRRAARPARPSSLDASQRTGCELHAGTVTWTGDQPPRPLDAGAASPSSSRHGRPPTRRRHDAHQHGHRRRSSTTDPAPANNTDTETTHVDRPGRPVDHQDRQPRPGHRRQQPHLHDHGHQQRPVRRPGVSSPTRVPAGTTFVSSRVTGRLTCTTRPSAGPARSAAPAPTLAAGATRHLHPRRQGRRQRRRRHDHHQHGHRRPAPRPTRPPPTTPTPRRPTVIARRRPRRSPRPTARTRSSPAPT